MAVSVVIPALNAAETLARPLESLVAQSSGDWEAIVVDDGSTDGTADVAREWSERDSRVRLLEEAHGGVSAARNAAIAVARHPLLLFLDADDEVAPRALEVLTAALKRDSRFAAAYGRWARVAPDGRIIELYPAAIPGGDLFPLLATYCVFAIHTCVVRRDAVTRAGGFDTSLSTCEDWDLWQRIARSGGRFVHVPEQVALYHLSAGSASTDSMRLLTDGLLVAERGHEADPRLDGIEQAYPEGAPREGLAAAQVLLGCWSAGLTIAKGDDPSPLLELLPAHPVPDVDPERAGLTLYESAIRLQPLAPSDVAIRWGSFGARTAEFYGALERRIGATGLVRQAIRSIERRLVLDSPELRPLTVGATYASQVDVTDALVDVTCPPGVDRAVLTLAAGDRELGTVELPVIEGVVPADVLEDLEVAAAWRLLGIHFMQTAYARTNDADHDALGWAAFLRELWDRPSWAEDAFYDPHTEDEASVELALGDRAEIDVEEELPTLVTDSPAVTVVVRCGGRGLGTLSLEPAGGRIEAQRLRAEITLAAGFELCRVAVVRGLVGRPLDGSGLRARLRDARERRGRSPGNRSILGRDPALPLASPARAVWLPAAVVEPVAQLAALTGQRFVRGLTDAPVAYAPGLVRHAVAAVETVTEATRDDEGPPRVAAYGRHHFEELLASSPDPWKYESAYEKRKYAQTLELVPHGAARVLEIGCAEGHFTVELAPLVGEVVAADLSEIALSRAEERCAGLGNVSFVQLDVGADALPGRFDVILCSELLYYVGRERLPAVAAKLADGLEPGGSLIHAHANLQVDEPNRPGFDWALPYGARHIGEVLARQRGLRLVHELRTPFYRVQRFERSTSRLRRPRAIVEDVSYEEPVDEVAATFRWTPASTRAAAGDSRAETWHLPILMYHRIADDGPEATARWRVTTAAFARQLEYLADAGFRTISLDEWRTAALRRRPLAGRAVVLTFDDGYVDFEANAWPLLESHGFGAVVALVTDLVGGVASWDARYGEPAPLLDWPAIRELARRGVEFASHAATHTPLTALSVDDMALECAASRLTVAREVRQRATTIVYPHGAHDPVVEHVASGLGYAYGLGSVPGLASFGHPLLSLPRQEITGDMSFGAFVRALAPPER